MKKKEELSGAIKTTLNTKISFTFNYSGAEYPLKMKPSDIIAEAYKEASALFNAGSESSIVAITLQFYMDHIDEAIKLFTSNLDDFRALLKLFSAYTDIHLFMNENTESLESLLEKELTENEDYYKLFPLNYYEELSLSEGMTNALAELNNDVNTRAFTFYNCAHEKYLHYLPGLKELLIKYGHSKR